MRSNKHSTFWINYEVKQTLIKKKMFEIDFCGTQERWLWIKDMVFEDILLMSSLSLKFTAFNRWPKPKWTIEVCGHVEDYEYWEKLCLDNFFETTARKKNNTKYKSTLLHYIQDAWLNEVFLVLDPSTFSLILKFLG